MKIVAFFLLLTTLPAWGGQPVPQRIARIPGRMLHLVLKHPPFKPITADIPIESFAPQILVSIFGGAPGIAAPPAFIQSFSGDCDGSCGTSVATAASSSPTISGHLNVVGWGTQRDCGATGFGNFVVTATTSTGVMRPTDLGLNIYTPIIPVSGVSLIGAEISNGGTNYGTPACTVSGGGTCTALATAGVVTQLTILTGTGYTPSSPAVITITDGSLTGSGATAIPIAYGIGQVNRCLAGWIAPNITGHASEIVTVKDNQISLYTGVIAVELSGLALTSPIDGVASATGTGSSSITASAYTTTGTSDGSVCFGRVEALSQTGGAAWAAGTGYTIAPGALVPDTFMNAQYRVNFAPNGTTPSISSGSTAARAILCVALHQ